MVEQEYPVGADPQELQARMEPWTEEIIFKGKAWKIVRRGLPWPVKKKAISEATSVQNDGSVKFDWERYYKICLKAMVVEAPFSINDISLAGMDSEFGELLEKLVPQPWPSISVESVKKESEDS